MEIFLSTQCESLTGALGRGYGYVIQRRTGLNGKTRFWGVRQSNGEIPADGHLRFIFACAELAQAKLHIAKIKVNAQEVHDALYEAGHFIAARRVLKYLQPTALMNPEEIINLKITFGL